jgi:predicted AAA+ superfamily ATPase
MFPMNFKEFLIALSHEKLIPLIEEAYENDSPLAPSMHEKLMFMHRSFLYIGGMPESVKSFAAAEEDITKYDETILGDIVEAYFKDMAKYVTNKNEAIKISRVYKSIPKQLLSVSNKFTYSAVSKGGRGRDYLSSIDWLLSNGMVMESKKVKLIEIPIFSFSSDEIFKLYLSDSGILSYLCELSYADFIRSDIGMYSGALAENYVANTLAASDVPLYFWESEGKAEIDFLMQKDGAIIPIEAKAGEKVTSKSLNVYMKRFEPKYGIRISAKNFGFENGIKSVPLYAAFCVK